MRSDVYRRIRNAINILGLNARLSVSYNNHIEVIDNNTGEILYSASSPAKLARVLERDFIQSSFYSQIKEIFDEV